MSMCSSSTASARVLGQPGPPIRLTSFFSVRVILAEGSALGDLDDPEDRSKLAFIFATYIGALKARQAQWTPVLAALQFTGLTKFVSWFIHPWLRATVYTGDRIAYAICDDLAVTVHAVYETLVGPRASPRTCVTRGWCSKQRPFGGTRFCGLRNFCARFRTPVTDISSCSPSLDSGPPAHSSGFSGQLASSAVEIPPEVGPTTPTPIPWYRLARARGRAERLRSTGNRTAVRSLGAGVASLLRRSDRLPRPTHPSRARTPHPEPQPEPEPEPEPEPKSIDPVPLSPDAVDASGSAPDSVDSSGDVNQLRAQKRCGW